MGRQSRAARGHLRACCFPGTPGHSTWTHGPHLLKVPPTPLGALGYPRPEAGHAPSWPCDRRDRATSWARHAMPGPVTCVAGEGPRRPSLSSPNRFELRLGAARQRRVAPGCFMSFQTRLPRDRPPCAGRPAPAGPAYLSMDSRVPSRLPRCSGTGSRVFPLILPPITNISFFSLCTCFMMSSETTQGHPLRFSLWFSRE